MRYENNEIVINIYRHHYFPFITRVIELTLGFGIIYGLTYFMTQSFSGSVKFYAFSILSVIYLLSFFYVALIYWLDKLILTNKRVLLVEWKTLTMRKEYEARINEIQDIRTREKGFLSHFNIFDYGKLQIDTASARSIIIFKEAPDPENIKHFIYTNILSYNGREYARIIQDIRNNTRIEALQTETT